MLMNKNRLRYRTNRYIIFCSAVPVVIGIIVISSFVTLRHYKRTDSALLVTENIESEVNNSTSNITKPIGNKFRLIKPTQRSSNHNALASSSTLSNKGQIKPQTGATTRSIIHITPEAQMRLAQSHIPHYHDPEGDEALRSGLMSLSPEERKRLFHYQSYTTP